MPSNKAAVAKHRQRINANPIEREKLLAKRRENYKKRKIAALGANPDHQPIKFLSEHEVIKKRQQWRENQRKHRAAKRAKKLDFTPDSPDIPVEELSRPLSQPVQPVQPTQSPPSLQPVPSIQHSIPSPRSSIAGKPLTTSTPEEDGAKQKQRFERMKKKNVALRRQVALLKKQLAQQKHRYEQIRMVLHRERKKGKTAMERKKMVSQTQKRSVSRRKSVFAFLSRDENSRLLPGKKDTITKNKIKRQRRVLSHTLKDLHSSFNAEVAKENTMSYRQFLRLRPFHITEPRATDRNTCACIYHENVGLLVERLKQRGILRTSSVSHLISTIVCDPQNKQCMYRLCTKCNNKIAVEVCDDTEEIVWEQFVKEKKTLKSGKEVPHYLKKRMPGTVKDLVQLFNTKIDLLARHQFNWISQAEKCRQLKDSLSEEEVVVHMDFSENYGCKLKTEIQAINFGANRQQATIHTCVVYTASGYQSYATISDCLRHDEKAVWAHLKPVLDDIRTKHASITTLHCMSDGPVTQYRNKGNFYLLSSLPFLNGFRKVTWNFSEACHGKGAPDGVGGAVKRMADGHVKKGGDIQTPQDLFTFLQTTPSNVRFFWVTEEDVTRNNTQCACEEPTHVDLNQLPPLEENSEREAAYKKTDDIEDISGKFVIVMYEDKPFIGQVVQVVGHEMEVSCMHQCATGKNAFVWPERADKVFYFRSDVKAVISEPEPLTMRQSKLVKSDWDKFTAATQCV
ncbi:uncharacterized protein LOC143325434 isoform X2 [Chaetodon auriga]